MVRMINRIFCTHIRKRVSISVLTRIENKVEVVIFGSEHCRQAGKHSCDIADTCERAKEEFRKWQFDGGIL